MYDKRELEITNQFGSFFIGFELDISNETRQFTGTDPKENGHDQDNSEDKRDGLQHVRGSHL